MLSLEAASQIAEIAGTAVSIIDKVYTQFVKFKTHSEVAPSPSAAGVAIVNDKQNKEISATLAGATVQAVSYSSLAEKLNPTDLDYIRTKERALSNYYKIWSKAYPEIALIASPMERATEETRMAGLTDKMGCELADILDFLEARFGLALDDHYAAIRQIARQ